MLFSIDFDNGSLIKFYLVPDSGGTTPVVKVHSEGVQLLTLAANVTLTGLAGSGRHSTGQCGFEIGPDLIADLQAIEDLEITEAESGLLVYRRPRPTFLEHKLFRLETHLLPLWRIDEALKKRFRYWYKGIERHGSETTMQVFNVANATSTFISGRILITNFHQGIAQGFRSVAIFRDPYDELAERLLVLKNATPKTREILGPRDTLTFEVVMEALDELKTFDEASLKRFFKRAPQQVFAALANPYVRLLTSSLPEEMPKKSSIGLALQMLAEFEILGLREDAKHFSQAIVETFDLAPGSLPVMSEYPRVIELGAILRANHDAELILEQDLELYAHTTQAFAAAVK